MTKDDKGETITADDLIGKAGKKPDTPKQPTCPYCHTSPARISVTPVQIGNLASMVFWCPDCGNVFNVQITGMLKPMIEVPQAPVVKLN